MAICARVTPLGVCDGLDRVNVGKVSVKVLTREARRSAEIALRAPLPDMVHRRIIQASGPLRYQLVDGLDVPDSRLSNIPRRYNGAPSQELLVIRQNHKTGERSLDLLRWGLVPSWSGDPKGGPRPINAMAETVRSKPMFREAYRKRRCIVPVEGFFAARPGAAVHGADGGRLMCDRTTTSDSDIRSGHPYYCRREPSLVRLSCD